MFSSAEVFAAAVTAAVVAAGVLIGGGISTGTLVAFLFLVTLFIEPVQLVVEILDQAQTAAAGLRRILGVLETESDVPEPKKAEPLPAGALPVTFASVTFQYPEGEVPALRDVSVAIPAGARVAVVGETGSGKTTFSKLLVRLMDPSSGEVRIGGVSLRCVADADLRARVSFVPQDGFLFDGTVADNVRYGRPAASEAEVSAAFDDLGLNEWIEDLPDRLATRVGERGGRLSSGERQLVALVRAWIAAPDLLVLAEATSAVDPALEVRLRQAMERLTQGRTSVTVAHRLSTAEVADEILVFDGGRLVERGSHADLISSAGVYAALHEDWSVGAGIRAV
jgi:ATP-binding cassette, subfamily B, bacterial